MHLVDGGEVLRDEVCRLHSHGTHTLRHRCLAHLVGRGAGDDELTNLLGDLEHLVHRDSAAEAGAGAVLAALAAEELGLVRAAERCVLGQLGVGGPVLIHTLLADTAHEALADNADE